MASQEERDRIMAEYLASVQDDDDDDEAEFQPGMDEEDEDDEFEENNDDEQMAVWEGSLKFEESKLSYQGKTSEGVSFQFTSPPLHWDLDHPTQVEESKSTTDPRMRTIVFKDQSKQIQFTIRKVSEVESSSAGKPEGTEKAAFKGKSTGEDDDDNDESEKKMSSPLKSGAAQDQIVIYTVFGQGEGYELYGEWKNADIGSAKESGTLSFDCRYKPLLTSPAAVASPAARRKDDDDEDLDEEKVDYNELIALHEDAGLPVQELRKRYRNDGEENGSSDAKRTRSSSNNTAPAAAANDPEEDDDDDDDDFDGF
mmetsp:Transcript_6150/g.9015  ORF Transcript_6150/g.9015 Transcript_6150/m.9015 type:complete len:312 (-) Transcript_6150:138-1073(-)